ncbi:ribonuclease M5 [Pilibacter termitis]|uniref:Ribonuclease M5 n=1 Tax=Pilibacter termitis TaxID=263852 RepID=A0A1T4NMT6_9ENTE|nr:ribonuclease M5 [Pilibacter termitis]SJZ80366.1 ribonuclease M5 [Pilibacter termitis]
MNKQTIQEVIVVEGKSDTKRIQEVVNADTIETNGSAINEDILEQIAHAQEIRGVIVFTDPDFSGEKIRKTIMEHIPTARHAFLPRGQAQPKSKSKGRSLGVEHASDQDILLALEKVVVPMEEVEYQEIPRNVLAHYGLLAGNQSKKKRELLGDELRIGYTNGKQLVKRLKMFRITQEELEEVMEKINDL